MSACLNGDNNRRRRVGGAVGHRRVLLLVQAIEASLLLAQTRHRARRGKRLCDSSVAVI